jgi:predicted nucleic acid-binding protein
MTLLMAKYPDLGFVDSSVVAIAERLIIGTIATTDRWHFTAVRPSHVERFTLVP